MVFAAILVACGGDGRGGGNEAETEAPSIDVSFTDTLDEEGSSGGDLLDVGGGPGSADPTAGGGDCPGSGGMVGEENSLIWIANSPEGTVSKIDTRTGQELARYFSGPSEGADDPSRTSVNLAGDVAVTNRSGSVTKIASTPEACVDQNGDGVIQTSTSADDVLAWGEDECVLWHLELPSDGNNNHGPRPTAWDGGATSLGGGCGKLDELLWLGFWDAGANAGEFRRIDGKSGIVLDVVSIPDWNTTGSDYGPYGGAVDGTGSLWAIGHMQGLVRIDSTTLEVERWDTPEGAAPYGIAIDASGRPWTAGWDGMITRFDPTTELFEVLSTTNNRRMRGLQVDREGVVWIAANNPCGAISVDVDSFQLLDEGIELPDCNTPVGVSIDVDGQVWLPDRDADRAFKLDPNTLQTTTTLGLVGPYTYSDMTGAGLGLVVNPPVG